MKTRAFVTVAALVVAFVAGVAMASAQTITVEIGFPFVAGGKDMIAGKYAVEVPPGGGPVVLTSASGISGLMPVITTLGRHDLDKGAEFVFDKIDGKMVLSEVWLPERDGFLVLATKAPHQHAVVGGSNPRK